MNVYILVHQTLIYFTVVYLGSIYINFTEYPMPYPCRVWFK